MGEKLVMGGATALALGTAAATVGGAWKLAADERDAGGSPGEASGVAASVGLLAFGGGVMACKAGAALADAASGTTGIRNLALNGAGMLLITMGAGAAVGGVIPLAAGVAGIGSHATGKVLS